MVDAPIVHDGRRNTHHLEPLPVTNRIRQVEYRIAYVALCIENSHAGRGLLQLLQEIPAVDPKNIQFCCAGWFWKRHLNSYALQVEPDRFKRQDKATLDYQEAFAIEKTRNAFFAAIEKMLQRIGKRGA